MSENTIPKEKKKENRPAEPVSSTSSYILAQRRNSESSLEQSKLNESSKVDSSEASKGISSEASKVDSLEASKVDSLEASKVDSSEASRGISSEASKGISSEVSKGISSEVTKGISSDGIASIASDNHLSLRSCINYDYYQLVSENTSFWLEQSRKINWLLPPTVTQTGQQFFPDGIINACHCVVDMMLQQGGGQELAFIFDDTDGHFSENDIDNSVTSSDKHGKDKQVVTKDEKILENVLEHKLIPEPTDKKAYKRTDAHDKTLLNYLHSHCTTVNIPIHGNTLHAHYFSYKQALLVINQISTVLIRIIERRGKLSLWYDQQKYKMDLNEGNIEHFVRQATEELEKKCVMYQTINDATKYSTTNKTLLDEYLIDAQQPLSNRNSTRVGDINAGEHVSSGVDSNIGNSNSNNSSNKKTSGTDTINDTDDMVNNSVLNDLVVTIYMPMSPFTIFTALACARLGITHNVIFGGYSINSVLDRIRDSSSTILISCMSSVRGKNRMDFYRRVKEVQIEDILIMDGVSDQEYVEQVLTHETKLNYNHHNGSDSNMNETNDINSATSLVTPNNRIHFFSKFNQSPFFIVPRPVSSLHPLFILYTSGSTGKPKGLVHGTGGYLVYVRYTMEQVFEHNYSGHGNKKTGINERTNHNDTGTDTNQNNAPFFCTADLGWITGHSYVLYGPLLSRCPSVVLMGLPTSPFKERLLAMLQTYKVGVFYTAPTLIRCLKKLGVHTNNTDTLNVDTPAKYNFPCLSLIASVGEPLNLPAYLYYTDLFNCPIIDTYFQTETGGIVCANKVGVDMTLAESCGRAVHGVHVYIVGWGKDTHHHNDCNNDDKGNNYTDCNNNDHTGDNNNKHKANDTPEVTKQYGFEYFKGMYPYLPRSFYQYLLDNHYHLKKPSELGLIIFARAWPGMALTILGNYERYKREYLYDGVYWTGDEGYCIEGHRGSGSERNHSSDIRSIQRGNNNISGNTGIDTNGDCNNNIGANHNQDGLRDQSRTTSESNNIDLVPAPYFFVRGRADDVLNVSGHRISTAEVESATNSHEFVLECAMVGRENELTGMGIVLFVVVDVEKIRKAMCGGHKTNEANGAVQKDAAQKSVVQKDAAQKSVVQKDTIQTGIIHDAVQKDTIQTGTIHDAVYDAVQTNRKTEGVNNEPPRTEMCHWKMTSFVHPLIKQHLREKIGALINPDLFFIVPDIPKTRTGKLMRRVLRRILEGVELGDVSTMGNMECLEMITDIVQKGMSQHTN